MREHMIFDEIVRRRFGYPPDHFHFNDCYGNVTNKRIAAYLNVEYFSFKGKKPYRSTIVYDVTSTGKSLLTKLIKKFEDFNPSMYE